MGDGLDRWREFFRGAGVGICDVIEKAILVAAADEPQEFLRRRDRTAERLYNALLARPSCNGCTGSSTVSLLPATPAVPEDKGSVRRVPESEKESKFDSSSLGAPGGGQGGHDDGDSDSDTDDERLRRAAASNYGHNYDDDDEEEEEEEEEQPAVPEVEEEQEAEELEALTNEMDEESQVAGEVLRIKGLLLRKEDHSDATLFESLRRLQLMQLSVSTLRATEIGRAVNGLRKHNSQQIRHLVQTLIQDWKVLVDEWVSTTSVALADNSPGSSNPSAVDDDDDEEEGLPSPPLDEGAFFAPETTAIQLSEFFDEMDEDGNLRHNNDVRLGNKRENNGRRPGNHSTVAKQEPTRHSVGSVEKVQFRRPELTRQEASLRQASQQKSQSLQAKPQSMLNKQSRPLSSESGSARPIRAAPPPKPTSEMRYKQTQEYFPVERKPAMGHVDKSRLPAHPSAGVKLELAKPKIYDGLESNGRLEAAKRRLQEGYQEAENAKKQRTIQVMELGDIPKPKSHNRQPMMKSRNHIRSRAIGRR